MSENEKKCCTFFSSPTYTNILLTIIALLLIAGVVCKHVCGGKNPFCAPKGGKAMMGQKAAMECPMMGTEMPAEKK